MACVSGVSTASSVFGHLGYGLVGRGCGSAFTETGLTSSLAIGGCGATVAVGGAAFAKVTSAARKANFCAAASCGADFEGED
jgi:hypothetical protein